MKLMRFALASALFIGIVGSTLAMEEPVRLVEPLKPIGLKNIGNSCFMNAPIQVLFAMHNITTLLNEQGPYHYKGDSLSQAYCNLLPQMMYSKEVIDPTVFCYLGWHEINAAPESQNDAGEFLGELLACLSYKDINIEALDLPDNQEILVEQKASMHDMHGVPIASALYDEASNYFSEPRKEPVHYLSLPVKKGDKSLAQCLDRYFGPEDEYISEIKLKGKRRKFIEGSPNYLICSFNRIDSNTRERLSNPLTFPLYDFKISNEYHSEHDTVKPPYELIGIIMHSGSAKEGHYTAYVKSGNQWHYCNDSIVEPLNEFEVSDIAQRGYGLNETIIPTTLVYERTDMRPQYQPAVFIQPKPQPAQVAPHSNNKKVNPTSSRRTPTKPANGKKFDFANKKKKK